MLKIIKYLKKSIIPILVIVGLLILQAFCDLSLPGYTSSIVDTGIQQGGIKNACPTVIREGQLKNLELLMDDDSKEVVMDSYKLITKEGLTEDAYQSYLEKYPIFSSENLYLLNKKNTVDTDKLNDIMANAQLLLTTLTTDSDQTAKLKEKLTAGLPANMANASLFDIISKLPAEQSEPILSAIKKQLSAMPSLIVQQSAVASVKAEYKAVGIDVEELQRNYILFAGLKMLGLALLAAMATISVGFLASRVAATLGRDLRSMVFKKVVSFSNTEFDRFSTASLITRSTNDIQQVQMTTVLLLRMVIYSPILAVGGIIKVLNTNTSMVWIIALAVAIILSLVGSLFIIAMPKFKLMQKLVDRLNLVTREILTGLSVIRAFHKEAHEEERFDGANRNLTKTNLFVNRVMTFMMPAMMLVMNGITLLIIWNGAKGIDNGNMQVGDLMAFIQYSMMIIMSFLMLSMVSIILPRASVSAGRIAEVINTKISIIDPKDEETFKEEKKGFVEFENVSFRYPKAEDDVLSDISFTARPGETTAIIGSTGSGKTTLINLIPRFFDVTKGSVKVDGVDVRKAGQNDLREKLGFVPQKGVLFSGTIDSNIKYGKQSASQREVIQAAKIAQAWDFIEEKPERLETPISQGGTNVSGGQKQRLSIARAIARDPEIYIFDDSFSALDYRTDVALRRALKTELGQSTVIIVAQRISTILHADQILVLDEGKIAGKGTHKELLKNCEVYRQIALSQLSKEELADE